MEYAKPMADAVASVARPLENERDLDAVLEQVKDSTRFVLLGEASHGTHEYYTWRAKLTKRLIEEKGFNFVAVEGDWPDCYQINRFVKDYRGCSHDINTVLHSFKRWPTFMWANWEVGALAEWMRGYNKHRPKHARVGFYGLDVYSLLESLESIINYLTKQGHSKEALRAAERALCCFERVAVHGKEDIGQAYGMATMLTPYSCRDSVVQLLVALRKAALLDRDPDEEAIENKFSAEMNAQVVVDAENYYQVMMQGNHESWNVRDKHMADTLESIAKFYGPNARGIIWEHNTHVGDARATSMAASGEWNIGQLAREKFGEDSCLIVGLGSYEGTVMAGSKWGAPMQVMPLPRARPGSWEDICHRAASKGGSGNLCVPVRQLRADPLFSKPLGNRAVGVVFNPKTEAYNYVQSVIPARYDLWLHIDRTRALHALHIQADPTEVPDTYPFGV